MIRVKGGEFFRTLRIKNLNSASHKKHIFILMMKIFGETNGDVKYSLPIWHQAQQRCLSPNPLFGAR